ncbi:MAG: hypothetical protein ACOC2D_14910, partial [Spirochaetota bacterium]
GLRPASAGGSTGRGAADPPTPSAGVVVEPEGGDDHARTDETDLLSGPLSGRARVADRVRLVQPVRFAPGEAITVRASHPGYLDATTTLSTDRSLEAAVLRVALVPRPSTLLINSRVDGAKLLVDGGDRFRAPGPEPAFVDAPDLLDGVTEVRLVPGAHRIEVRSGDARDAVDLLFAPGSQAVLRLVERADGIDLMIVEEP